MFAQVMGLIIYMILICHAVMTGKRTSIKRKLRTQILANDLSFNSVGLKQQGN